MIVVASIALASGTGGPPCPGCATSPGTAAIRGDLPAAFDGPDHTEVDLLRAAPGGPRIYVQAVLPDGERGLFLVDTGADISVLSRATAERLGLPIREDYGSVVGLGGTVSMDWAVLPSVSLGGTVVPEIEVGVGVPGVSDRVGAMPLDGLLGNNVWSRFVLEIDYPADLMVLHAPGTLKARKRAGPMTFDGYHVFAPIAVRTEEDVARDGADAPWHTVSLRVDTGAGELSVCGGHAAAFGGTHTEGLEPIYGIGASETLPPYRYLQMTRRIPLAEVSIGGARLPDREARWMDFDGRRSCPDDMRGLAGHELLDGHRVVFDYGNGRLELGRSKRKPRQMDGHAVLLAQEIERHGEPLERGLIRARYRAQLGELDAAARDLEGFVAAAPPEEGAEGRVALATLRRHQGRLTEAWEALAPLSPGELVDRGEIVASVNGLIFEGRVDDALALAVTAVSDREASGWAWVALADALVAADDQAAAHDALTAAVEREQYPDAHLLRRARVALASGDRYASLAHVRRLLQLYPMGGEFLWFYALLVDDDSSRATFLSDVDAAMLRLHPSSRPLDFLVAAHENIGDHEGALAAMADGISRDCLDVAHRPAMDNCLAWYWSLARIEPDESLRRIERALAEDGDRSDFLDTKAMVHLARGEYREAHQAAIAAARLSPDNVYMLWQAERIADLASESTP